MPLVIDHNEISFRLNYLFNRVELSRDARKSWTIFFQDENDSLGTIFGLTCHRGSLFIVTYLGVYVSPVDAPDFKFVCPQRKGGDYVDIESFDNMLYACTNTGVYQASSGVRWRLKYDGQVCGNFFSLLQFKGKLFAACEKGVYLASQEGKFWHPRYTANEYGRFLALDARGETLYAQTDKGYCLSHDNGQHWEAHPSLQGPWTDAMGGGMLFAPRPIKKRNR